jgi:HAD superfamily hydrolase (TIGR01509 family)
LKGYCFDLDGTLIDSMWVWDRLPYDYLLSKGINPPENIREQLKLYSLKEASLIIKDEFNLKESSDEINFEMENMLKRFYESNVELKDGALELLQYLKANGSTLCLATATEEKLLLPAIKRLGIYDYFDFIQTCGNVGFEKYDINFFKILIDRLNLETKDVVLFEDALYSMETAKKLGIKVVAIKDPSNISDWDKITRVADIAVDNLSNLNFHIL